MRRYGVVVLVLSVVAGCTSGGKPEPSRPALIQAWRVDSFTPVGQPVAVGDVVVGYGSVGRDLLVFGISTADGSLRWRQAASPSTTTSGVPLSPTIVDGRVAYLRPDPSAGLAARLVVAATDTGTDLLVSEPLFFTSQPATCEDEKDVCVSVLDGGRTSARRFSLVTRGPVPNRGAAPAGSRYLGTELIDLGQRNPELVAGFKDGNVVWQSPLSRHFSPGHTSDASWHFGLFRSVGLHVGSVGRRAEGDRTKDGIDLSKVETAAIRAADGSSAWRADSTTFLCHSRIALEHTVAGTPEYWPVRCRIRGVLRNGVYEGLDVTVEGFDISTGTTTWSVPLGAARAFFEDDRQPVPVSDREVLVQGAAGPLIIDVSNGGTRRPEAGDAFWCGQVSWFQYREAKVFPDGRTIDRWRGGTLVYPCAGDGSPAAALPRSIAPSLGGRVGGRTVLALPDALVAYDTPAPKPA